MKDAENELPIPSLWRPAICEIVKAFVKNDYLLKAGVASVAPVSAETATQIEQYIRDYGETLDELPEETWSRSVCIWMGGQWDALIDLWTVSEGGSDLVLSVSVFELDGSFEIHIRMVYVP